MFELPLLPPKIRDGKIRRRVAARYGSIGSPSDTLRGNSGANVTIDGLHLSDVGSLRMATLIAQSLSGVFKLPAANPSP